jgi:hypothetical protein
MKEQLKFRIGPGGKIETIYKDGIEDFAEKVGADVSTVCRASHVEWEESQYAKGWTVRSAKNPKLALCDEFGTVKVAEPGQHCHLMFFKTREEALRYEVKFFWELIGKGKKDAERDH